MPARLPSTKTLLILSGMGIPLYSARGLTQDFDMIDQAGASLLRDTDGNLQDFSPPNGIFHKYTTTISCTDLRLPMLSGIWPGSLVTIHCVFEFCYATSGGTPDRAKVPNAYDSGGRFINPPTTGQDTRIEGDFTYYRPIFPCRVRKISGGKKEYPGDVNWTLEAEEV